MAAGSNRQAQKRQARNHAALLQWIAIGVIVVLVVLALFVFFDGTTV